jgi:hypothetical protein
MRHYLAATRGNAWHAYTYLVEAHVDRRVVQVADLKLDYVPRGTRRALLGGAV